MNPALYPIVILTVAIMGGISFVLVWMLGARFLTRHFGGQREIWVGVITLVGLGLAYIPQRFGLQLLSLFGWLLCAWIALIPIGISVLMVAGLFQFLRNLRPNGKR
jgi:hypothetical protein